LFLNEQYTIGAGLSSLQSHIGPDFPEKLIAEAIAERFRTPPKNPRPDFQFFTVGAVEKMRQGRIRSVQPDESRAVGDGALDPRAGIHEPELHDCTGDDFASSDTWTISFIRA